VYRSGSKTVSLPEESDVIQELEAHWEALRTLVRDGVHWVHFDFTRLRADDDVWEAIEFDICGLISSGIQVDLTGGRVMGRNDVSGEPRRRWANMVEEWHRAVVGIGITLITLMSIASLLIYKAHELAAPPETHVAIQGKTR